MRIPCLGLGLFAGLAFLSCTRSQDLILQYDRPASFFEEALPIGNGSLGAMVYGGTAEERISLNDITLWTGEPESGEDIVKFVVVSVFLERVACLVKNLYFNSLNLVACECCYNDIIFADIKRCNIVCHCLAALEVVLTNNLD